MSQLDGPPGCQLPTVIKSFIFSKVFGPIPGTSIMSSIVANGPSLQPRFGSGSPPDQASQPKGETYSEMEGGEVGYSPESGRGLDVIGCV